MKNEDHRKLAMDAYAAYANGSLNVETFSLAQLKPDEFLPLRDYPRAVYVLRLGTAVDRNPSFAAIANQADRLGILYIGGHESGKCTGRYNALLKSCRAAEAYFVKNGHAFNDRSHSHPVARNLTTSLVAAGFQISDCIIDIFSGGEQFDELEFIIGYQECYHHLPPWNTVRGGASAYSR